VVAQMMVGRQPASWVSFDVNPTSRQTLAMLARTGHLASLIEAGARLHQTGCNGCIGMGQAPASDQVSLRTVPRNFPNRSETRDDQVYLCSPETAAASALAGAIADPRGCRPELAPIHEPSDRAVDAAVLLPPSPARDARRPLVKGPNIGALPVLEPLPERVSLEVALCVGDDVSTDAILPAGSRTAASEQPRGDRALRFCRRGPRLRRPHQAAHSGAYDRRWQQLRAGVQP
jgi:aconitate hydratase